MMRRCCSLLTSLREWFGRRSLTVLQAVGVALVLSLPGNIVTFTIKASIDG